MSTYLLTFDRIGRNHDVRPLSVDVDGPNHLAERVCAYARPYLASRHVEVAVDLDTMTGRILVGFRNGGTFTIAAGGGESA